MRLLKTAFEAANEARAMRESVWRALERVGIHRDRPATWTVGRPPNLRHLKADPAFQKVASPTLLAAIDAILDGLAYPKPDDWGAVFLAFPSNVPWHVPTKGWLSAIRRAPQLGQKPRPLQLNATSFSAWQLSQRTRRKPCSSRPHFRYRSNSACTWPDNRVTCLLENADSLRLPFRAADLANGSK